MNACGIICEYNPFHNGHAYHISKTKALLGDSIPIVCLMSGFFVQRGDAALFHRDTRTAQALAAGADLILELPLPFCLSSAEGFALGGVDILNRLGILTHLSFGAEQDDLAALWEIAAILLEKSTIDDTLTHMTAGISYAAARERALFQRLREKSALIRTPNNILAVEYLKAILSTHSALQPLAIQRTGTDHDSCKIQESFASASHIRQLILSGYFEQTADLIPTDCYNLLRGQPKYALSNNENLLLSQLLRLSPTDFSALPGVSEGLEHRLYHAVQSSHTIDEITEKAKSKRYPHTRIRRILLCGFLGLTREMPKKAPYVRVLGHNDTGRRLLACCRKTTAIPIITKPAHIDALGKEAISLFQKEELAAHLYHMLSDRPVSYRSQYVQRPLML